MRFRLKGLARTRKRLANGVIETYYYAWRGGPRINEAYGTPEFVEAFNRAVLARILSWSVDRGIAPLNPCKAGGVTYRAKRATAVWTDHDEAAFYAKAPAHLHLALRLALWTGQRQGDLLNLK